MIEGLAEGVAASSVTSRPHPKSQAAVVKLLAQAQGPVGETALRIAAALKVSGAESAALASKAARIAASESARLEERALATGIVGLAAPTDGSLPVARFLAPKFPAEVRMAAAKAVSRWPPEVASPVFLGNWRSLSGAMRETAVATMLKNGQAIGQLLDAIENNQIQPWAVGQARLRSLQQHDDPKIRARATTALEQMGGADRLAVVKRYLPSVHRDGNVSRGKQVFERACAECHELDGVGKNVGPDLRGVTKRYKETLLASILMPSEAIEPGYEEYVVETADGRLLTGILAKDTASSITLRRAKGEEDVVPRSQIRELRTGGTSPMPDGMEKDITVEQMADLIAYLKVPK
jgi:putative heme-binding domain-containing protein